MTRGAWEGHLWKVVVLGIPARWCVVLSEVRLVPCRLGFLGISSPYIGSHFGWSAVGGLVVWGS